MELQASESVSIESSTGSSAALNTERTSRKRCSSCRCCGPGRGGGGALREAACGFFCCGFLALYQRSCSLRCEEQLACESPSKHASYCRAVRTPRRALAPGELGTLNTKVTMLFKCLTQPSLLCATPRITARTEKEGAPDSNTALATVNTENDPNDPSSHSSLGCTRHRACTIPAIPGGLRDSFRDSWS